MKIFSCGNHKNDVIVNFRCHVTESASILKSWNSLCKKRNSRPKILRFRNFPNRLFRLLLYFDSSVFSGVHFTVICIASVKKRVRDGEFVVGRRRTSTAYCLSSAALRFSSSRRPYKVILTSILKLSLFILFDMFFTIWWLTLTLTNSY